MTCVETHPSSWVNRTLKDWEQLTLRLMLDFAYERDAHTLWWDERLASVAWLLWLVVSLEMICSRPPNDEKLPVSQYPPFSQMADPNRMYFSVLLTSETRFFDWLGLLGFRRAEFCCLSGGSTPEVVFDQRFLCRRRDLLLNQYAGDKNVTHRQQMTNKVLFWL